MLLYRLRLDPVWGICSLGSCDWSTVRLCPCGPLGGEHVRAGGAGGPGGRADPRGTPAAESGNPGERVRGRLPRGGRPPGGAATARARPRGGQARGRGGIDF
eukprot:4701478-Pyramimonas_sp.AAC.1